VDHDVVVDQLDLLTARKLRGGAGEQATADRGDGDASDSQRCGSGNDVRDCETAFHTITLLSSICHETA
jgi:hypothetical protein